MFHSNIEAVNWGKEKSVVENQELNGENVAELVR